MSSVVESYLLSIFAGILLIRHYRLKLIKCIFILSVDYHQLDLDEVA